MDKQLLESSTVRNVLQLLFIVLGLAGVDIAQQEQVSVTEGIVTVTVTVYSVYVTVQAIIGRIRANPNLWFNNKKINVR